MNKLYVIGALLMVVALVGFGVMLDTPVNACDPADPECRPASPAGEAKFCDPGDPSCGPDNGCEPTGC